ncbi:MAG: hypothetical protein IJA87_02415 [Clostridia bacterium]|nr:hypothetical protein [Clostridia bacterium]
MINSKQIEIAKRILQLSEAEVKEFSIDLDNTDAVYISVPIKGGASVIISADGEVLYANSSVSFDVHVREFLAGRRTPLSAFEQVVTDG